MINKFKYFYVAFRARYFGEPEIKYITNLNKKLKNGIAIDVGANVGEYTYWFERHFRKTIAFEPIKECCAFLDSAVDKEKVFIANYLVSNTNGFNKFFVPIDQSNTHITAHATMNSNGILLTGKKIIEYEMETVTIDSFISTNSFVDAAISVIKIDVEGYEEDVIIGANHTLLKYKPILIIECENRHRKNDISNFFIHLKHKYNYDCFFLHDNKLLKIENLNLSTQIYNNIYINNFIFLCF